MAFLGERNLLRVTRETFHGVYLDAEDMGEVLLPRGEVPIGTDVGEELDVFLYRDSEDRLIATVKQPKAKVGEIAVLRVRDFDRRVGAFLDWGLLKDLLLPHREQTGPVYPGDDVVVYVALDDRTDRIFASMRLWLFLSQEPPTYDIGQPVDLLIARQTEMGWNAVVEGQHIGLLYHNQIHKPLHVGLKIKGYIAAIRPDGKIDLNLDSSGRHSVMSLSDQILEALEANGGRLNLDDDSPPEAIRAKFGASKKAYKQAIGQLYREQRILLTKPGIQLAPKRFASRRD
jgi:hypothetical protein